MIVRTTDEITGTDRDVEAENGNWRSKRIVLGGDRGPLTAVTGETRDAREIVSGTPHQPLVAADRDYLLQIPARTCEIIRSQREPSGLGPGVVAPHRQRPFGAKLLERADVTACSSLAESRRRVGLRCRDLRAQHDRRDERAAGPGARVRPRACPFRPGSPWSGAASPRAGRGRIRAACERPRDWREDWGPSARRPHRAAARRPGQTRLRAQPWCVSVRATCLSRPAQDPPRPQTPKTLKPPSA